MNPLITVITVVYNGEKYIEQTILSVIEQKHNNIEYIIIDGQSTDSTCEIIKRYDEHIDYWISEKDNGIYDAMNKGIKKAKGSLISFLNADDWYESNALQNIIDIYLKNSKVDFIFGDLNVVNDEGYVVAKFHGDISKWKKTMPFGHPTLFVRSEILKNYLFDTNHKVIADYDFIETVQNSVSSNFK